MRTLRAPALALVLLPSVAAAQSVQVRDPSTGLPVFSSANPAPVTVVSNGASGTSATQVQGNVASGATDSGNPVKTGCVNNSTLPTVTTGQRVDCQAGTRGSIHFELYGANNTNGLSLAAGNTDGVTAGVANDQFGLFRAVNGSGTIDRMRGDTNGVVVQPGLSTSYWYYTSGTTAILSNTTTAVTIKTAAGASVRNYIDACQIASTALGASVPLAIRDGAAGTVIWAMRPPTAGWTNPVYINFSPPLRSTANTLLEIVTTTADTSGTFDVNCQGHTGT